MNSLPPAVGAGRPIGIGWPRYSLAQSGVTIIEVLASAMLILLGIGAVFAVNSQSLQILRRTREAGTSSQILQERIESMRTRPWPEVSRAQALATWWQNPPQSAADLADTDPTERLTVSAAPPPGSTTPAASFEVERRHGVVQVLRDADLSAERLLVVELQIAWRDSQRLQERRVKTIIGRAGLTRSGIFGSAFGRAELETAATPP